MSTIRANSITNAAGTGAPDFPNGLTSAAGSSLASPMFTGVASFPDGTAAAPSITNTDDTNTGIFFPAADTVAVATGGTERLRITSAGDVGVGGSPTAFGGGFVVSQVTGSSGGYSLQASGSVVTQMAADSTASVGYTGTRSNHPHVFTTNNTERVRIDTAGQIGIGGANYGTSGQVLTSGGSGAAPSWASVGTATAGLEVGSVGSYAFLAIGTYSVISPGTTLAGSSLRYTAVQNANVSLSDTNANMNALGSGNPAGTWRCMGGGGVTGSRAPGTVWLRIS